MPSGGPYFPGNVWSSSSTRWCAKLVAARCAMLRMYSAKISRTAPMSDGAASRTSIMGASSLHSAHGDTLEPACTPTARGHTIRREDIMTTMCVVRLRVRGLAGTGGTQHGGRRLRDVVRGRGVVADRDAHYGGRRPPLSPPGGAPQQTDRSGARVWGPRAPRAARRGWRWGGRPSPEGTRDNESPARPPARAVRVHA